MGKNHPNTHMDSAEDGLHAVSLLLQHLFGKGEWGDQGKQSGLPFFIMNIPVECANLISLIEKSGLISSIL